MKKMISLILAGVMAISMLSGCNSGSKTTSSVYNPDEKIGEDTGGLKLPLVDKDTEISWAVPSGETGLNDSYVVKKIRAVTGINLQLNVIPNSSYAEKIKILIASQKLPDIIGTLDLDMANDIAIQGALASVEDYMDKLPNFKRTFVDNKENNWIFKSYKASDDKLYGFYGWDYNRDVNTGAMLYRKDIFDKHGLKMWNSPEEFYQTLKKLKELYPNSTPLVSKNQDGTIGSYAKQWQLKAHEMYYDEGSKKWKFTDVDPKYKEVLDFLKKLYDEKLVDPEFLTCTQADWTSKMTKPDKAFVTCDWIGRMTMFKDQTEGIVPGYDLRFANPVGPDQTMPQSIQLCWAKYVAKTNKQKEEAAFKLMDFCLSPAGKELITMGVEGETYTMGEDGKADYIEFPDHNPTINELENKYGMYIEGMYLGFDRRSNYFQFTDAEQEAQDFLVKHPEHREPIDPELVFTPEETTEKNDILAKVGKAGKEFAVKYILSGASWDEWVKTAESMNIDKLAKIYNDAQKRYDAE